MSVDDHPLLREGIAAVVNSAPDMAVVAQAATAERYQGPMDGSAAGEHPFEAFVVVRHIG